MAKITTSEVQAYVVMHGGILAPLANGNFNIRGPLGSANVGKPSKGNRWDSAQFRRAWGDATGIPDPEW